MDEWLRFSSQGLNPFYVSTQEVTQTIERAIPEDVRAQTTHVYFYGAGCSSPDRNQVLVKGIRPMFTDANVEVDHDLLAAARASCHNANGVVSILGTGSNSCKYDGTHIVDNVENLGFLLGDEGSGADIGRALVKARCYREMPEYIQARFDEQFDWDKEKMLQQVYHRPMPNRYMASFAPFCSEHKHDPFIQDLVKSAMLEFVDRHLLKYDVPEWNHHFIGSIAAYFEDELSVVMKKRGLKLGQIIKHPVHSLLNFHLEQHAL
jgi:N-acetylglucosamine kinase-like BadF-type ATPase